MKNIVVGFVSGLFGGVLAFIVAFTFVTGRVGPGETLSISYGPVAEETKALTLIESAPRPQGFYVRYRNDDSEYLQGAHFSARAFKEGKLWHSWDMWDSHEVAPGAERETIIAPLPFENSMLPDLTGFEIKVELLSGMRKTKA